MSPTKGIKMPSALDMALCSDDDIDFDMTFSGSSTNPPECLDLSISPEPTRQRKKVPDGPVCPMCGEQVDQDLLDDFGGGQKRMKVYQQQTVCRQHKVRSAKAAWASKGYPEIEWLELDSRISRQHRRLKKILKGGKSHYSERFGQSIKSGQSRTLFKTKQSLTPGYYGLRGLRAMTEAIIEEFSGLLRIRAVQDRLISARGHTAYVQAVLVPELTVQLIMEDMNVTEEEARDIMQESIAVGELLHEDLGDEVPDDECSSDGDDSSKSTTDGTPVAEHSSG
jgi:hypothetical protein